MRLVFLSLLSLALAGNVGPPTKADSDRLFLLSIPSLTFVENHVTTSRRADPHQQLVCVGGDAAQDTELQPVRVDCYNVGVDQTTNSENPQPKWHCVTELHRGVTIAEWKVKCEGYSYPGDAYVYRGSCWLEYMLQYSDSVPAQASEPKGSDATVYRRSPWMTLLHWGKITMDVLVTALLAGLALALALYYVVPVLQRRLFKSNNQREREDASPLVQAEQTTYNAAGEQS